MPYPILTGQTTPTMRERASVAVLDVDTVVHGLMTEDYRPPARVVQLYVRAVRDHLGKWRAVGLLAARLTGRTYKDPDGTAQAWGDGVNTVPSDVLIAFQQAFPHLRLTDFALAPAEEDAATFTRRAEEQAVLEQLREQVAVMNRHLRRLAKLTNDLEGFAVEAGPGLGIDFLARRRRAAEQANGDPELDDFLSELRGEKPESGKPAPASADEG